MPAFLVQISDSHIREGNPEADAALAEVVAAVCALPVPPTAVLFSGDLTDDGRPGSYARVRELLAPLTCPIHVLAGNHDDYDLVHELFGAPDDFTVGDLRLLCARTHQPGTDAGHLDVDALAARLDDRPTVVAMHHPPLRTGIAAIDALGLPLPDRDALEALLARSPQVLRVLCGHVHRITFETLGGVGVFTCPATYEQAEPAPGGGLAFVARGRAFAIHTWLDGRFVTQIQAV